MMVIAYLALGIAIFLTMVELIKICLFERREARTANRRQVATKRIDIEIELDELRKDTVLVSVELNDAFQAAQQLLAEASKRNRNRTS